MNDFNPKVGIKGEGRISANIFDIQHSSYHDGPGLRTVVFFKGCNMRCFWCQNPESLFFEKDLLFYEGKCIKCEKCIKYCPNNCIVILKNGKYHIDREFCIKCGKCAEVCFPGALQLVGEERTIGSVIEEVITDLEFYHISGGGVTLSGGEPLLQEKSCYEILRKAKEKSISTAIETAGNVKWSAFTKVIPFTDYLLFDIKTINNDVHKIVCGKSNLQILNNLEKLSKCKVGLIIRVPIIPGVNDNKEEIKAIANKVKSFPNLKNFELIPFHQFGKSKYLALGRKYEVSSLKGPTLSKLEELKKLLTQMSIPTNNSYIHKLLNKI
jgi:pyruvate formate lyase activating enzyme